MVPAVHSARLAVHRGPRAIRPLAPGPPIRRRSRAASRAGSAPLGFVAGTHYAARRIATAWRAPDRATDATASALCRMLPESGPQHPPPCRTADRRTGTAHRSARRQAGESAATMPADSWALLSTYEMSQVFDYSNSALLHFDIRRGGRFMGINCSLQDQMVVPAALGGRRRRADRGNW